MSERRHFAQVNDKTFELINVKLRVPQGLFLGPALFNLYANDLNNNHDCMTFQYADDTALIKHCTPSGLEANIGELNNTMRILEDWLSNNFIISTYLLSAKKTLKQMMSRVSAKIKSTILPKTSANGKVLDRVTSHEFLGVWIQMDWSHD